MDWVESSGAVVTDQHGGAPLVMLGEDLCAAATSALAVKLTDQIFA